MPHILIAEDDRDIADLIDHSLRKAGHETEIVGSGSEALARARAARPDALVLDVMLPGLDGMQVCRALRAEPDTAATPIIMVTARGEEADRVGGLELGADDYLTKPFSPRELVARVAALLRRSRPPAAPTATVLRYRDLVVDGDRHRVTANGAEVKLTAKEFLLLQYMMQRAGRVVSRDQLLTDVWGYQYTGGTRTVDVHVRRLREKIPLLEQVIETVKQFGYKLAE
ncbi:MAG: response regulator transcription factor [Acidobacteria bacterium]|nr:response regulator transcription factor [Acidobacteriota bacterium]